MSDFFCNPSLPVKCPDCDGLGRKPYPANPYPCSRCEGTGLVVKVTLTCPEYLNTGFQPCGRTMFAGIIERPYKKDDC